jgi:hypothetical protein
MGWLGSEKLRTLRRSHLNDPIHFTSLVVRQAPCFGEKFRLREPSPSVVFGRLVGSEKLTRDGGLVIGDGVASARQIDDYVAAPHIQVNIC